MRVCLFVDSYLPNVGGLEYAVHYLGNALVEEEVDVTVFAKKQKSQNINQFLPKYRIKRYGYTFKGSGRTGANNLSSISIFIKEHIKNKFDIINCHNVSYAASRARIIKKLMKIPLVLTPHGDDVETVPEVNYGMRLSNYWDRVIQKNLRAADAVTTISNGIRSAIPFIPEKKIYKIPNGINTRYFTSCKSNFLQRKLSLKHDAKIILSVGRYDIVKGYEYGISAVKKFLTSTGNQNYFYVIIGKNTNILNALIKESSLEEKVFILPNMDQKSLAACYNSAWCFFSPSIIEGMSLVSLEAMASGLPLIVTDVPGNIDIVKENNNGIVVKSRNSDSMANGMMEMIREEKKYIRLSKLALSNIKLYDWQNIAKMYIAVYEKVLDTYKYYPIKK
jgi:glycosyltransferase involved in cell wall biosynthesis